MSHIALGSILMGRVLTWGAEAGFGVPIGGARVDVSVRFLDLGSWNQSLWIQSMLRTVRLRYAHALR